MEKALNVTKEGVNMFLHVKRRGILKCLQMPSDLRY